METGYPFTALAFLHMSSSVEFGLLHGNYYFFVSFYEDMLFTLFSVLQPMYLHSDDDEDDDYVEELRPRLKTSRNFFGSKPNIDPTTLDTCGNTLLAPPSKHDDALVQNNPISTRRASSTDYTSTSSMSSAASLLKSSSKKDGWTDTDSMSSKRTGKMKVKAVSSSYTFWY